MRRVARSLGWIVTIPGGRDLQTDEESIMHDESWLKYGVIALLAVGLLVLIGVALNSGGALEGPTWVVQHLTVDGTQTHPIEGSSLTATFDGDNVSGLAGCNSFSGGFTTDGDSIEIGPLASTMVFCDGVMDQEAAYLTLLQSADSYSVDGDTLTLEVDGGAVLEFTDSGDAHMDDM
jgi:heat shock protein HslJ